MGSGKTFLIFGGIDGIGGALAEELLDQGNDVYVTTSQVDKTTKSIVPADRVLQVDVLNHATIQAAVEAASQQGLHGLAYCVGTIDLKPLSRTSADDLMRSFQINTVGAFLAVKSAAAVLAASKGAVVLFSSIAASRGFSNHSAIACAKAGLEGLARSLAAELAPNVRINVIAPSLTDTPLAKPFTQNAKMSESIAAMHPIPRLGTAQEMAKAAAFLLSESAGWMSGQTLHIDGGRSNLENSR